MVALSSWFRICTSGLGGAIGGPPGPLPSDAVCSRSCTLMPGTSSGKASAMQAAASPMRRPEAASALVSGASAA